MTLCPFADDAVSDLGLHCVPMSHKMHARLICVNMTPCIAVSQKRIESAWTVTESDLRILILWHAPREGLLTS